MCRTAETFDFPGEDRRARAQGPSGTWPIRIHRPAAWLAEAGARACLADARRDQPREGGCEGARVPEAVLGENHFALRRVPSPHRARSGEVHAAEPSIEAHAA